MGLVYPQKMVKSHLLGLMNILKSYENIKYKLDFRGF